MMTTPKAPGARVCDPQHKGMPKLLAFTNLPFQIHPAAGHSPALREH